MEYSWSSICRHVAHRIEEALEGAVKISPDVFVTPPDAALGELAFPCFPVAKALGKNPAEIAQVLEKTLADGDQTIERVKAAGPYLNIALHGGSFVQRVVSDIEKMGDAFGVREARGSSLVFEYANPNTHKEIHIGHLRNFLLGASLVRILEADGWKVVPVSYINDVGANVAKCLWYLAVRQGFNPMALSEDDAMALEQSVPPEHQTGGFLGRVYAEATRRLDEHPEEKEQVSSVHLKLEQHDPAWEKVWRETRRWCTAELRVIFQELGVRIEKQYAESELLDRSQDIVQRLERENVAVPSEGALVVNLEDEGAGVALLRKTDGALLYLAKDLALAEQKVRDFPTAERSMFLVDTRQALNFKQLFAILKRIGFTQAFQFVGYEIVTLKEGVMSSRKGNVVTWEQFRDDVVAFAREETIARHPDWNEGKVIHTAWCLMMGGVKYGMLKQDSEKPIIFDAKAALSFDGNTGPYIQYAVTRLRSILRKAKWEPAMNAEAGVPFTSAEPLEKKLALSLAALPEIVAKASAELRPSLIAQWCYATATDANAFYRDVPVLQAVDETRQARFRLVAAAVTALTAGLGLLGIPVPEDM